VTYECGRRGIAMGETYASNNGCQSAELQGQMYRGTMTVALEGSMFGLFRSLDRSRMWFRAMAAASQANLYAGLSIEHQNVE
jgi:hypothetical protein